jgi:hypothetical protein
MTARKSGTRRSPQCTKKSASPPPPRCGRANRARPVRGKPCQTRRNRGATQRRDRQRGRAQRGYPSLPPDSVRASGNAYLIETIKALAQRVYGIRSYANALLHFLMRANARALTNINMIKALRASWRDELIKLTRRHLKPSPQAYIRVYERKFGTSMQ